MKFFNQHFFLNNKGYTDWIYEWYMNLFKSKKKEIDTYRNTISKNMHPRVESEVGT